MNGYKNVTKLIMWIYVNCGNFDTVIFALPIILFVTLLYCVFRLIWHKRKFGGEFGTVRKSARLNEIIRLLTVCWAVTLICITLTPTESLMWFWIYLITPDENPFAAFFPQLVGLPPRSSGEIVLMPKILNYILIGHLDWLWWSAKSIFPHLFLNAALYVPLGLAMPFIFKKISLLKVFLTGLSVSFVIEFTQIFIGRESEMDDLICNTLGAVVGYLLYLLIKKLFPKFVETGKKTVTEVWLETLRTGHETGEEAGAPQFGSKPVDPEKLRLR